MTFSASDCNSRISSVDRPTRSGHIVIVLTIEKLTPSCGRKSYGKEDKNQGERVKDQEVDNERNTLREETVSDMHRLKGREENVKDSLSVCVCVCVCV